MSQQNQYPYGSSQQQSSQQRQSGQAMTPEQMAAFQAYLANRAASSVPGYPHVQAATAWSAGYAPTAQGYPAAPQGYTAFQRRVPPASAYAQGVARPTTPSRSTFAAYPPPPPPATPAPVPTDDKPFPCEYCSCTFARQHDLRRHVETHTSHQPHARPPGRQYAYTRKDALKRHLDGSSNLSLEANDRDTITV